MSVPWRTRTKIHLASVLARSRVTSALLTAQRLAGATIRAVNYHDVPRGQAGWFEEQLRFFRRRFDDVTFDGLTSFLQKRRRLSRPGILLSFDDGFRSHAEVVAPLLEKHGFTGWFFIPAGLVTETREESDRLALATGEPPRLTWQECQYLADRHVVGCHTMTHVRLKSTLTDAQRRTEIHESKRLMERRLGRDVPSFCWVGGEEWSYSAEAAQAVRDAGYRLSFMTNNLPIFPGDDPLQLQRTNLESSYPMSLVEFQLSGLLDIAYAPKRRRVVRLTRG